MIHVATASKSFKSWQGRLRRPLIFFGLTIVLGFVATVFAPRKYESDAKIFVRLGRESVGLDPTAATVKQQSAVSFSSGRESEINSIVQMINNRELYEHVVTELTPPVILEWTTPKDDDAKARQPSRWDLTRIPSYVIGKVVGNTSLILGNLFGFYESDEFDRAVDHVEEHLTIRAPRKSTVVTVAYRSHSPVVSQRVVSAFCDRFLESHPKWNRAENSTEFFEQQVTRSDRELNVAHAAFAGKKNEMNVASLETHREELAKQLSALETELMLDRRQLEAARKRLESLQATLDDVDKRVVTEEQSGMPDAARDTMRSQLYALELQERELAARFHDNYPPLVAVREQLRSAEALLASARDERSNTTKGLNPIRTEAETALALQIPEVASWKARVDKLESQREELRNRIHQFNQDEIELAALNRKVELAEATFRTYAKSLEESRVDHALQNELISNVNIVQAATFRPEAVFPRELLALIAFGLFGFCGGALMLWRDLQREQTLRTAEQMSAAFRAPVVASFPFDRENATLEAKADN